MKSQILDLMPEIAVDLFAGGGGTSTGIEEALGFPPHVAINHSPSALSMHRVNHPFTRHYIADVFEVDPHGVVQFFGDRPVGSLHLSPDCTHHSQASGGQPRDAKVRGLSWVGKRWAAQVRPRVITLENVKQILKWGPLVAKRDKKTGRVVTLEMVECPKTKRMVNRIAEPGEQVPVSNQFLVPDSKREGRTWRKFVRTLQALGYAVEHRVLIAADYGAPTTRERLFMIARCDGQPIVWPEPTHAKVPTGNAKKWRAAAECIDWSVPCPSIFTRKRPLADATLRRIAKGMVRYVLNSADPFIVPIAHFNGSSPVYPAADPLNTITAYPKGGTFALSEPVIDALVTSLKEEVLRKRRHLMLNHEEARKEFAKVVDFESRVPESIPELWCMANEMHELVGDEWWTDLPEKPNPDYVYLCRIIKAVQEGIRMAFIDQKCAA